MVLSQMRHLFDALFFSLYLSPTMTIDWVAALWPPRWSPIWIVFTVFSSPITIYHNELGAHTHDKSNRPNWSDTNDMYAVDSIAFALHSQVCIWKKLIFSKYEWCGCRYLQQSNAMSWNIRRTRAEANKNEAKLKYSFCEISKRNWKLMRIV